MFSSIIFFFIALTFHSISCSQLVKAEEKTNYPFLPLSTVAARQLAKTRPAEFVYFCSKLNKDCEITLAQAYGIKCSKSLNSDDIIFLKKNHAKQSLPGPRDTSFPQKNALSRRSVIFFDETDTTDTLNTVRTKTYSFGSDDVQLPCRLRNRLSRTVVRPDVDKVHYDHFYNYVSDRNELAGSDVCILGTCRSHLYPSDSIIADGRLSLQYDRDFTYVVYPYGVQEILKDISLQGNGESNWGQFVSCIVIPNVRKIAHAESPNNLPDADRFDFFFATTNGYIIKGTGCVETEGMAVKPYQITNTLFMHIPGESVWDIYLTDDQRSLWILTDKNLHRHNINSSERNIVLKIPDTLSWSIENLMNVNKITDIDEFIHVVTLSPDEKFALLGGSQGTVFLADLMDKNIYVLDSLPGSEIAEMLWVEDRVTLINRKAECKSYSLIIQHPLKK